MVVCLLGWAWVSALGAAANAETRGMIISRTGETLILSTSSGEKVTVLLTDETVTKDDRGLFGLDKEHLGSTVLIPGLKVKVDGTTDDQGRVVAKTITTDGDDLETAEMIQAGLHPTAQQVNSNMQAIEHLQKKAGMTQEEIAANKQANAANQQNIASHEQQIQQSMKDIEENSDRFKALSEYDVKGQATVNFNVGSSKLSPAGEEELKKIAETAAGLTGYIIEVVGYTDSTGSPAMNTTLSENRAKAVVTYLMQQGNVPVRHIIAPGAMGEYGAASTNETKAGRAENRRVDVKILVNKGIAGS